jgi:hypothetical protein
LEQRQQLQQLFFPEGVAFSGKSFDRTVVTSSLFEYLRPFDASNENLVAQIFPRWNPLTSWIRQIEDFQRAAQGSLLNGNPPFGHPWGFRLNPSLFFPSTIEQVGWRWL